MSRLASCLVALLFLLATPLVLAADLWARVRHGKPMRTPFHL